VLFLVFALLGVLFHLTTTHFLQANAPILTEAQKVKAELREQEQAEKKQLFLEKERKKMERLKARKAEQERLDREAEEEEAGERIRAAAEVRQLRNHYRSISPVYQLHAKRRVMPVVPILVGCGLVPTI